MEENKALDKLKKFAQEEKITLKISQPFLVQGKNGLEFGPQNIIVGYLPEPEVETLEEELPKTD